MNEPDTAVWMCRLAALSRNGDALPDPAIIWWQAQLLEKQAARARAVRPMAVAQWVSLVVAVVAAIVLCAMNWAGMQALLGPVAAAVGLFVCAAAVLIGLTIRFAFGE